MNNEQPTETPSVPKNKLKLSSLKIETSATRWLDWQHGIKLRMHYLPKATLQKLMNKCMEVRYNQETKLRESTLNTERFVPVLCQEAVSGWEGVTPRSLAKVVPVNLNELPKDQWDEEIAFSQEDLVEVVKSAYELDAFIQQMCVDLSVFHPDSEYLRKN